MLTVIFLRHGETAYNADGNRYCGRTDIGLTEKGIGQAGLVQELLKDVKVDAVYSSPLQRARVTAEIASGRKEVVTDERLIEVDFGKWEALRKEEFLESVPGSWEKWIADPSVVKAGETGETGAEVVARVTDFFYELKNKHTDQTVMVVAHNGVNRLFMAAQLGMPLAKYRSVHMENASITVLEFDAAGTMLLKRLNANNV